MIHRWGVGEARLLGSLHGVLVVAPRQAEQVLTPGLLKVGDEVTRQLLGVTEHRLHGAGLGAPEPLLPGAGLSHHLPLLGVLGGLPPGAKEVAHEPHEAADGKADGGNA